MILYLIETTIKCSNNCATKINEAKSSFESKKIGQNLKRKYLIDGLFKNEQVKLNI